MGPSPAPYSPQLYPTPTSQNASCLDSCFILNNNTMKKVGKTCQYLHGPEQSTHGCSFSCLPLQVTCYPPNLLNPREERHETRSFPFLLTLAMVSHEAVIISPRPGPQKPFQVISFQGISVPGYGPCFLTSQRHPLPPVNTSPLTWVVFFFAGRALPSKQRSRQWKMENL